MEQTRYIEIDRCLGEIVNNNESRTAVWLDAIYDLLRKILPEESRLLSRFRAIMDGSEDAHKVKTDKEVREEAIEIVNIARKFQKSERLHFGDSNIDRIVRDSFQEYFFNSWPLRIIFILMLVSFAINFGGTILNSIELKNTRDEARAQATELENNLNVIHEKSISSLADVSKVVISDFNRELDKAKNDIENSKTYFETATEQSVTNLNNSLEAIKSEIAAKGDDKSLEETILQTTNKMTQINLGLNNLEETLNMNLKTSSEKLFSLNKSVEDAEESVNSKLLSANLAIEEILKESRNSAEKLNRDIVETGEEFRQRYVDELANSGISAQETSNYAAGYASYIFNSKIRNIKIGYILISLIVIISAFLMIIGQLKSKSSS